MIDSKTNLVHHFNVEDAKAYGVQEAVFLYNIRHWVQFNLREKKNIEDGRVWTYCSKATYLSFMVYFSEKQLRTIIKNLKDAGILLVGNFNRKRYDNTNWYTINEEWTVAKMPTRVDQKGSIDNAKTGYIDEDQMGPIYGVQKGLIYGAQCGRPIPYNNTNIKIEDNNIHSTYVKVVPTLTSESASPDLLPIKSKPKSPNKEAQRVLELWNEIAKEKGQLSKAMCLDDKRTRHILKASSELFKTLEDWRQYFYSIYTSDFLLGHSGRSWRASFDWVINSTNAIKVLEGKYFNKAQSGITASGMSVEDVTRITREIFGSNE